MGGEIGAKPSPMAAARSTWKKRFVNAFVSALHPSTIEPEDELEQFVIWKIGAACAAHATKTSKQRMCDHLGAPVSRRRVWASWTVMGGIEHADETPALPGGATLAFMDQAKRDRGRM
jgi:hypothetical protein